LKTDILLSTYNGALFLEELMRSLYAQTFPDWRLFIRDDGSSDNTTRLLEAYRQKDPQRIIILDNQKKHLGPKKSFEELLKKSDADYIMFCDQDDVWLPDKIQNTLAKMKELEQTYPGQPVMVFTDLKVTDKNLQVLHPSFWKYTNVRPENVRNIYKLLINTPVVGCTVMINKNVKPVVLPFPEQAVMHDWWIALNVARKGVTGYLRQPAILYRLHDKNSIGATPSDRSYYAGRMAHFSKTFSQNMNAVKMLKTLDFPLSLIKYTGYKIVMTFLKLF